MKTVDQQVSAILDLARKNYSQGFMIGDISRHQPGTDLDDLQALLDRMVKANILRVNLLQEPPLYFLKGK